MSAKTTPVETPPPLAWLADDPLLADLWQSSLEWRIEFYRAEDNASEQRRLTKLAYALADAHQVITIAEAERRWGKQNLRSNARDRLRMWQDQPGSPWLTTIRAMTELFGDPKH